MILKFNGEYFSSQPSNANLSVEESLWKRKSAKELVEKSEEEPAEESVKEFVEKLARENFQTEIFNAGSAGTLFWDRRVRTGKPADGGAWVIIAGLSAFVNGFSHVYINY